MPPNDEAVDAASVQLQPMGDQQRNPREIPEGGAESPQVEQSNSEKVFAVIKSMIMRGLVIYFIMSFFRKTPSANQSPGGANVDGSVSLPKAQSTNLFNNGMIMDLYIYLSEQEIFSDFNNTDSLIWMKENLEYGDWNTGPEGDGTFSKAVTFQASKNLQNNGSIYLHTFIVRAGKSPDPSTGKGRFAKKWTIYRSRALNKFKKRHFKKTTNLLTGETETSKEDLAKLEMGIKQEIVSHWHPNITINLVIDQTPWVPGQVPPPLDEFVEFTPSLQNYKPILYLNDYWNLNKEYQPINDTVTSLNLTMTFQPISLFKWQMYSAQQMKNRFNMMGSLMGEEEDEDQDSIKEAFLETNIYLLVITFIVSIVHSIFEFLAFKNDIQFWKDRKSLEGLSVRSVFFNVFQSLIVLLYVLDNETNTIIKCSCFVGLGIEIWKINKVVDISIDPERKFLGILPWVNFKDKGSYEESGTKQYDRMAFKYLGIVFFPLAVCYCVYSVIYNEHKGWYSFLLSSCYGFLLTFGFIMMTPQLFINYKLKSVAHLPWRMMTYKALNTFIDDIFAFVIKMPTMYRIGCFRDDIVFFIFLYQRYIYRVDHSRMNEFGFSGDMLDEVEQKKLSGDPKSLKAEEKNSAEQKNPQEKKKD